MNIGQGESEVQSTKSKKRKQVSPSFLSESEVATKKKRRKGKRNKDSPPEVEVAVEDAAPDPEPDIPSAYTSKASSPSKKRKRKLSPSSSLSHPKEELAADPEPNRQLPITLSLGHGSASLSRHTTHRKMAAYVTSTSLSGGKRQIRFSMFSLDGDGDDMYEPPFPQRAHRVAGYCNGLFCLEYDDGKCLLWNPSRNEFKFLPQSGLKVPPCSSPSCPVFDCSVRSASSVRGLGFDPTSGDYKVVRFAVNFYDHSRECHCRKQVEVYSLLHDSWEEVEDEGGQYDIIDEYATYIDGVGYWIGIDRNRDLIISFDFSSHQFTPISLPSIGGGFVFKDYGLVLTKYEYEESISLAFILYERRLRKAREMNGENFKIMSCWVRETSGEWIKRMHFKFRQVERSLGLCGDFLLYEGAGGELVVYDDPHRTLFDDSHETKYRSELDDSDQTLFRKIKGIHGHSHSLRIFRFVESRVLLKSSKKKKRKNMMAPKKKRRRRRCD